MKYKIIKEFVRSSSYMIKELRYIIIKSIKINNKILFKDKIFCSQYNYNRGSKNFYQKYILIKMIFNIFK